MARGSRSPNGSSRSHYNARDRPPLTDSDRDLRGGRREKDRDYGRERDRPGRSRYDDNRDRSRFDDRRRDRRDEDEDRYRSRRDRDREPRESRGPGRNSDRDRERERDSGREPEWGVRAGGSSRRSASPRGRSGATSARGSRSRSPEDKGKPNFGASGLLAAETKTVKHGDGTKTVLKYHEPPEARKPLVGWRLYVFKDNNQSGECYWAQL